MECNGREEELTELFSRWQDMEPVPPANIFPKLQQLHTALSRELSLLGDDIAPAHEVMIREIDALEKKPPSKRNFAYYEAMVWGKLNDIKS